MTKANSTGRVVQMSDPDWIRFGISPTRDWFLNQLNPAPPGSRLSENRSTITKTDQKAESS